MTTPMERLRAAMTASPPDRRRRHSLARTYEAYKAQERDEHERMLALKASDPDAYAKLPARFRAGAESYATHRDAWKEING